MTIHLNADPGKIAETILLPGDPLRAKFIAENYLKDAAQHNDVRGMLGFTGEYNGKPVSVQGTGMGMPSISIYVHELINDYGAKNLIRIGTCGAIQANLQLNEIVLAQAACTDSNMNSLQFNGMDYAPAADFSLLKKAYEIAKAKGENVTVGSTLTSDTFYGGGLDSYKKWIEHGVLTVEMETAALYTLAAKFKVKALAILTVTDNLSTKAALSSKDRQTALRKMVEIALELVD